MKANFPAGEGGGGKSGLGKQAGQHGMILRQPVSHTVRKRGLGDSRLGILIVCKKRDRSSNWALELKLRKAGTGALSVLFMGNKYIHRHIHMSRNNTDIGRTWFVLEIDIFLD